MDQPIKARRSSLEFIIKKKTSQLVDFVVPAEHGVNIEESEKADKCQDLA